MRLQDLIKSLDELSVEDQASLFNVLKSKLAQMNHKESEQTSEDDENRFWQGISKFRETIEQEGIIFADEDFANLRDRSPGRETER
jgi:hypothetical protein